MVIHSFFNYLHAPNYDAVLHLKQPIWPLLKKQLPQAEWHIFGAYESQKVKQLHNEKKGFFDKWFCRRREQRDAKCQSLFSGLALWCRPKGKLIDAMQNGTPCGMSTVAAKGMFGVLEPNGFIEDLSGYFVALALGLCQNETLLDQAQQQGFKVLYQRFDTALFEATFFNSLNPHLKDLNTYRQANLWANC